MSESLISILPTYVSPSTLAFSDKLPCHTKKIEHKPIKDILERLDRQVWVEGLYARATDLPQIKRYKNAVGSYKNDFDEQQFLQWVKNIEDNIVICAMENKKVGKGIFVLPQKKLPKGTFIPSSGIIKLNPTREDLETKNHCSVLQDFSSAERKIVGLIDPAVRGGILDLINHAPDPDEITDFKFKNHSIKDIVATANLRGVIKFYNGYAIMGVEVFQDIDGGEFGAQLLWSYAQPDEYLGPCHNPELVLFDNRSKHNGEVIDINNYSLRKIAIFLDTGEIVLRKVASLTRWELMKSAPDEGLIFSIEDPYSSMQADSMRSPILHVFLQTYLQQNPAADRVIIKIPADAMTAA